MQRGEHWLWRRLGLSSVALVTCAACGGFTAVDAADAGPGADAGSGEDARPSDAAAGDARMGDASSGDTGAPEAGPGLVAFVTSVGYADVTTVAAADTKCRAEADGRLPGKFVAWFSSAAAAAPSRLVDSKNLLVDGPWFRTDGLRIAATRAALLATDSVPLENPIKLTATGKVMGGGVWTGTHADGTVGSLCPAGMNPTSGAADQVGPAWTDQTFFVATCNSTSLALYCFQVE